MKKVLIFVIILLSVSLLSCDDSSDSIKNVDYAPSAIILENDGTFEYNGNKYHKYELNNYGYLIYDNKIDNSFSLRLEAKIFNGGIYPRLRLDDTQKNILYLHRESVNDSFGIYHWLWITEGSSLPFEQASITKIELKIHKDQTRINNYDKEPFDNIFKSKANVKFQWEEDPNEDTIYVDAYVGYAYISFYSEEYKLDFEIVSRVYQDAEGTKYIHLVTKKDSGIEESKWYLVIFK